MYEGWNLSLYVVQSVYFDTTLMLTKLSPWEQLKTEVNRCRVEGIDVTIKFEDVRRVAFASLLYHVEGEVLKDAIVTILIRLGKVASGDVFSDTKMVAFLLMRLQCNNQVTKTRTVAELAKHQGEKLIPTSEMLHIVVSIVLLDYAIELASIEN